MNALLRSQLSCLLNQYGLRDLQNTIAEVLQDKINLAEPVFLTKDDKDERILESDLHTAINNLRNPLF